MKYYRGYEQDGRFVIPGMPADWCPPNMSDLEAIGYRRTEDGIVKEDEPVSMVKGVLAIAAIAGLFYLGHKLFEPQERKNRQWIPEEQDE